MRCPAPPGGATAIRIRLRAFSRSEANRGQQELIQSFNARLFPVIGQVAKEKNLWAVFSTESCLLWHDAALDLSEEVAKRLDGSAHAEALNAAWESERPMARRT
jgi:hypothetical protein